MSIAVPTESAIHLRRRVDLEVTAQQRRGEKIWVVKDPIALRYFELRHEEYQVLQWLDGTRRLSDLKQLFEQRFTPRKISSHHLQHFLSTLHRDGLVIADANHQGDRLLERHRDVRRRERLAMLANPLAIRFPGIDPTKFLDRTSNAVAGFFSLSGLAVVLGVLTLALMLVVFNLSDMLARLPDFQALSSPGNVVLMAAALAVTKVLHELGHAYTCRHFRGHCHEIGVMLLVFTPCLYCNVTDSWKLSNRWQRIAIGAAGILVELVLAALCTILWWYTQPGLLNTICFNVVLICSIGTVLLNGNPLLRYDGYYILSDWLQAPNLWQDSRRMLQHYCGRWLLGIKSQTKPRTRIKTVWLLLYAIASLVYRVVVVTTILYLFYRFCERYDATGWAKLFALMLLLGMATGPINHLKSIVSTPGMWKRFRSGHLLLTAIGMGVVIAVVCFLPLPTRLQTVALIQPHEARHLYVTMPGRLWQIHVAPGDPVQAGDRLASLQNRELRRQVVEAKERALAQEVRVAALESLRGGDPELAAQIPQARQVLADYRKRLSQLEQDHADLTLTAPIDGIVIPPPRRLQQFHDLKQTATDQLGNWFGTPLDKANRGATLERREHFCSVGPAGQFQVEIYFDQSDAAQITPGQTVKLSIDTGTSDTAWGVIRQVAQTRLDEIPDRLVLKDPLTFEPDKTGGLRQTIYRATVDLDSSPASMVTGAIAEASVTVSSQTLWQKSVRAFSKVFRPLN